MHQARKHTHKSGGSYSQGNICNCMHQLLLNLIGFTRTAKVLQACERTRKEDETCQQDPIEELGEHIMQRWDIIEC